jgi:hypothetical protein
MVECHALLGDELRPQDLVCLERREGSFRSPSAMLKGEYSNGKI